jgi:hypothetical protein
MVYHCVGWIKHVQGIINLTHEHNKRAVTLLFLATDI